MLFLNKAHGCLTPARGKSLMDMNLVLSLIANAFLLAIQTWALCGIRNKRYLFKYYTYLQNFISILVSTFFMIAVAADCMNVPRLLTAAKGFRYVATCGLVVTMFVFTFLSIICREGKNRIGSKDCKPGYPYRLVNTVLHYIAPVLAVISFLWFEKPIVLTDSLWTAIAAIPSILYWMTYLFLTVTKKWNEPYNLSVSKSKAINDIAQVAFVLLFAVLFVFTSILLWENK